MSRWKRSRWAWLHWFCCLLTADEQEPMRRWTDEEMGRWTDDHYWPFGCTGCASCAAFWQFCWLRWLRQLRCNWTQPSALFLTSTARPCPRSPLSPPPRPASCRHCCPPPTLHPSPCRHSSCCRHQHPPPSPPRHRCRPSSPPCCWYWGWSGSQRTNRLTRVGSRDAYASKKQDHQRWMSTVDKLQVVWQMDRLMRWFFRLYDPAFSWTLKWLIWSQIWPKTQMIYVNEVRTCVGINFCWLVWVQEAFTF